MKRVQKGKVGVQNKGLSGYAPFLGAVKDRIRAAQVRATLSANAELIYLYWDIGRAITAMQEEEGWGAGVIPRLAQDIANDIPNVKGFSERNLKYMIRFAREYGPRPIVQQPVALLQDTKVQPISPQAAAQLETPNISPQPVAKLAVPAHLTKVQQLAAQLTGSDDLAILQQLVAQLPWFHHIILMEKVKDLRARLWYAQQTITHGWSRSILALQIKNNAHARAGKAVHNFHATLPPPQSDLAAQVLKDPYIFDFLTLTEPFRERELELALLDQVQGQEPDHRRIRAERREEGDWRVRIPAHPRAAQGVPVQPADRRGNGNGTDQTHSAAGAQGQREQGKMNHGQIEPRITRMPQIKKGNKNPRNP